ncbi:hypothetical protein XENORESO_002960, partial [Xenotaenia resolanae]
QTERRQRVQGAAQSVRMWRGRAVEAGGTGQTLCQRSAEGGRARPPLHALSVMRNRKGTQTLAEDGTGSPGCGTMD